MQPVNVPSSPSPSGAPSPRIPPAAPPSLSFRFATPDDVPLVLRFIRRLAAYEKMEHLVSADESTLREQLFSRRAAEVLFALQNGREIAFALFFHNFSTFLGRSGLYLEDLFVEPDSRGQGVGTALFRQLARIALDRGCGRFEWWCLDWNAPAIRFYRSLGAIPMSDWTVFRIDAPGIQALASRP